MRTMSSLLTQVKSHNDAQSESFLLSLKKAASMFSKAANVQGRAAKFSLGSVFICGSSDREARKLSEARGREGTMLRSSSEQLQQCCCVLVLRRKKNRRESDKKKKRILSPVIE